MENILAHIWPTTSRWGDISDPHRNLNFSEAGGFAAESKSKNITHRADTTGTGKTEDVCQRVNFYYDSSPFNASLSANPMGRQTAAQWFVSKDGTCTNGYKMTETFSYSVGGLVTDRRL